MSNHKVHKYLKAKTVKGERTIYRCMLPNCPHYVTEEFIKGRECICWRCGDVFVISGRMHERTRPYCGKHNKVKESLEKVIPSSNVDNLLKKLGIEG
jgi:hypothetical protein